MMTGYLVHPSLISASLIQSRELILLPPVDHGPPAQCTPYRQHRQQVTCIYRPTAYAIRQRKGGRHCVNETAMSGFASFATGNPSFCRSPPAHASQPLRTSPLKSSYIPASRNASPTPSSSSRDDGGRDDESDVGSTSHSGSDSGDEDLVFFGTPTSAEARSIARLSQAIPATPLPSTPSKGQKVVWKRDSREFLRRQTILHQPYNGCTPVKGAQQKQEEKAGRKVWPGGFFDRPLAQREDEEETDFAPTPARFGRRKTPSPTRRHEDDGLALDFGRMGLASPAVAAPEARRARRSSSLASTTSSDRSEEVLGMDVFEGCLSTDDELADSDKENCPGPDEAHSAITEQSEEGSADLFDGPVSEVLFPENSLNAASKSPHLLG